MSWGKNDEEAARQRTQARQSIPVQQVFRQDLSGEVHELMKVHGLHFREAMDSEAHPNSLDLAFFQDMTGSMGQVRTDLAYKVLPPLMAGLIEIVSDMQVCFGGFGDYYNGDRSVAWQVGQYEADGEKADFWLTHMCKAGGGTPSESAEFAFYFGAYMTKTDAWEKRQKKGYLVVTTDDTMRPTVKKEEVNTLLGRVEMTDDLPVVEIVRAAQERKHCFVLVQPHRTNYHVGYSHPGQPFDAGNVVGCYEYYLGAPYVIVPPRMIDTAAVTVMLVGLTEGVYQTPQDVRQALSAERFGVMGRDAEALVRSIAKYGHFLYPKCGWKA